MISLERIAAQIGAALLLILVFLAWYALHDHHEQRLGAQACISSTTDTKQEVEHDNSALEAAHAALLTQVVATYDQHLKEAAGINAALAQRLHDRALRQDSAPHPAGAACPSPAERGLPESQSAALDRLQSDTAAVLDACDADHQKVIAVSAAYNDWRQKMIEAAAGVPR